MLRIKHTITSNYEINNINSLINTEYSAGFTKYFMKIQANLN